MSRRVATVVSYIRERGGAFYGAISLIHSQSTAREPGDVVTHAFSSIRAYTQIPSMWATRIVANDGYSVFIR